MVARVSECVQTYCWLVELFELVPNKSTRDMVWRSTGQYATAGKPHETTTKDAWDAMRFPDRAEADRCARELLSARDYEWRATDHVFIHSPANREPR